MIVDYCSVDDIEHSKNNKTSARGMCSIHYQRWKRHGDPIRTDNKRSLNKSNTKEYILENIKEEPAPQGDHYKDLIGPCWIWQRHITNAGYGQAGDTNGKRIYTHRLSYQLFVGELTKQRPWVLHKCDIRLCCNPDHLYSGTHKDNMKDISNRDRGNPTIGENSGMSKLTNQQVKEIRELYAGGGVITQRELSERFNIDRSEISRIVNNKTWKCIAREK